MGACLRRRYIRMTRGDGAASPAAAATMLAFHCLQPPFAASTLLLPSLRWLRVLALGGRQRSAARRMRNMRPRCFSARLGCVPFVTWLIRRCSHLAV